eukprot:135300_1
MTQTNEEMNNIITTDSLRNTIEQQYENNHRNTVSIVESLGGMRHILLNMLELNSLTQKQMQHIHHLITVPPPLISHDKNQTTTSIKSKLDAVSEIREENLRLTLDPMNNHLVTVFGYNAA